MGLFFTEIEFPVFTEQKWNQINLQNTKGGFFFFFLDFKVEAVVPFPWTLYRTYLMANNLINDFVWLVFYFTILKGVTFTKQYFMS